jgi:DNA-binding LytR/AlgR family response regulator
MSEDKWTVGKEFLLVLFVLAILTVLISIPLLFLQNDSLSFTSTILRTSAITIAISVLPILVLILFEQYRHQKLQLKKANDLTNSLKNQTAEPIIINEANNFQEKNLLIKSETDDVELQLNHKDFIYAKSDGNYIEIYFLNSNEIQKKLIRNRLKNIETLLPKTTFLRCHNSFIVNGNAIVKIEGNARNLELHLKDVSETIPVSRAKAPIISEFLKNLR